MENTNEINIENTNTISLVPRKTIAWISYNYKINEELQFKSIEMKILFKGLKNLIFEAPLAWWTERNNLVIALDSYSYIKVKISDGTPIITEFTILDESSEFKTVIEMFVDFYNKILKKF